MTNKQWVTKTGRVINIADMTDSHLANTISMLRQKGFISNSELEMYLYSEPNGEMAQELYFAELIRIKTHPSLDELEAEQERRRKQQVPALNQQAYSKVK
jgi:hypothetical protein